MNVVPINKLFHNATGNHRTTERSPDVTQRVGKWRVLPGTMVSSGHPRKYSTVDSGNVRNKKYQKKEDKAYTEVHRRMKK